MRFVSITAVVVCFMLSILIAKSDTKKDKALKTLEETLKSGKPTLVLFTLSQACPCTMKRCKAAEAIFDTLTLPENVNKFLVDCVSDTSAKTTYKIAYAPIAVLFDKNGNEFSRTAALNRDWLTGKYDEMINTDSRDIKKLEEKTK